MASTPVQATVSDDGTGDALFTTSSAHGLSTDDIVYIYSKIENYNGLHYINETSSTTFKLNVYGDGFVRFINTTTVDCYTSLGDVPWTCAHLPIVYKRQNNRFPINSVDTSRTVSSVANETGFTRLNLSGSLSYLLVGPVQELDFIIISGAASPEVNGIFQVIDIPGANSYTLNFPYNSVYSYAGSTVLPYYQNYHQIIQVWVGLEGPESEFSESENPWHEQKPYELAGTIKLIPDSNNIITFSIHEIVKAYVKNKNNLTLGTLPNNIDAYVNFYCMRSESHDKSNGYTLGTHTADSQFMDPIGYAVNAMLPFKNKNAGILADYVMKQNFVGKFLTLFAIPVLFSCADCNDEECRPYQDVSCIIDIDTEIISSTFSNFDATLDGWFNTTSGGTTSDWVWNAAQGGSARNTTVNTFGAKNLRYNHPVIPSPTIYDSALGSKVVFMNIVLNRTNTASTSLRFRLQGIRADNSDALNTLSGVLSSGQQTLTFTITEAVRAQIDHFQLSLSSTGFVAGDIIDISTIYFTYETQKQYFLRRTFFFQGIEQISFDTELDINGSGVYRIPMYTDVDLCAYDKMRMYIYTIEGQGIYEEEEIISEVKVMDVDCGCSELEVRTDESQAPIVIEPTLQIDSEDVSPWNDPSGNWRTNTSRCLINEEGGSQSSTISYLYEFPNGVYKISFSIPSIILPATAIIKVKMGGVEVMSVPLSGHLSLDVEETFIGGGSNIEIYIDSPNTDEIQICGFRLESKSFESIGYLPRKTDLFLTWQNNLGGFDYWRFTPGKDIMTEVIDAGEQETNIFPSFPESYGEFADTINRQTFRKSREQMRVRSQHLTLDQLNAINYLRKSTLVQIIKSQTDRRTVIVDKDSFVQYQEYEDRLYTTEFTITFTDDNPVQTV